MTKKKFLLAFFSLQLSFIHAQDECANFRAKVESLLRDKEKMAETVRKKDAEIEKYKLGKNSSSNIASSPSLSTPCDCSRIQRSLNNAQQRSRDCADDLRAANNRIIALEIAKGDTTRAHIALVKSKNDIIADRTNQRDVAIAKVQQTEAQLNQTKIDLGKRNNEIDQLTEKYALGLTRLFLEYEKPGLSKDVYYVPLGDERLNGSIGVGAGKELDKAKIKPKNAKRLILLIEVFSTEPNDKLSVDVKIAPKSNRSATVYHDTAELEQNQDRKAGKYYYFSKTVSIDLKGQKKLFRSNNILESNIIYVCNVSGGDISGFDIFFSLE